MPSKGATLQGGLHDRQGGFLNFTPGWREKKILSAIYVQGYISNAVTLGGQIHDRHLAVWWKNKVEEQRLLGVSAQTVTI